MEYSPLESPADQLAVLMSRLASLKASFGNATGSKSELTSLAEVLEQDLLNWSDDMLAAGSLCSYRSVHDPDSRHTWSGEILSMTEQCRSAKLRR